MDILPPGKGKVEEEKGNTRGADRQHGPFNSTLCAKKTMTAGGVVLDIGLLRRLRNWIWILYLDASRHSQRILSSYEFPHDICQAISMNPDCELMRLRYRIR